jgi:hypothetical protein
MLQMSLIAIIAIIVPALAADEPPMPSQAAVEKAQQQVQTLKVWKMTEMLDLKSEQEVPFFSLFNELEALRQTHLQSKKQLVTDMTQSLEANSGEMSSFSAFIDRYRKLESDFGVQQDTLISRIAGVLNPRQMVAFYVADETFAEEVRRAIATERWKAKQNEMVDTTTTTTTEAAFH